jgi:2-succinyl-5-enolpyruvyl-6-hydroxy-3-cyclohexene-1-carboxylate synthase
VSETQQLIDPDRIVAAHLVGKASRVCAQLNTLLDAVSLTRKTHEWIQGWRNAETLAATVLAALWTESSELTEPLVARTVVDAMSQHSNLVLSSSMPVRDVEWFAAPRDGLRVLSNRGVNGIDGVVSTAVGVAIESNQMTALLIGDIALLHDTNGLLNLRDRNADLKVVVVDNGGGGIFSFLPQATTLSRERFEQLFGTPHKVDIEQLVGAHGVPCTRVASVGELRRNLQQLGTHVLIVNTDRDKNVSDHEAIYTAVAVALRGE